MCGYATHRNSTTPLLCRRQLPYEDGQELALCARKALAMVSPAHAIGEAHAYYCLHDLHALR